MANTSARFIAVAYNPADPTGCSDVKMSEGSALSNSKKEGPSTTSVDGSATGGSLRTPRALLLEHGGRCSLQDKVDRAREVGAEALFLLNVYGVVGSVEEEQVIGESDVVRHVDDTKQQSEGASTGNDELAPDTPSSSTPWRASILIVETDRPTSDWLWSRLPSNTTNGVGPRTTALVLELLLDDQLLLPSVLEAVMVVLVLVLSLALIVSMLMHLHSRWWCLYMDRLGFFIIFVLISLPSNSVPT